MPPAIAFRQTPVEVPDPKQITKPQPKAITKIEINRDILDVKRLKHLLDHVGEDVKMLQKMHMSADLNIPPPASIDPNAKPPSGESSHYEVFEVHWQSHKSAYSPNTTFQKRRLSSKSIGSLDNQTSIKIERIVNFTNRNVISTSSSKSQITEMLKPVRVKYGT